MKPVISSIMIVFAVFSLCAAESAETGKSPIKVFILAGQSNMDGQANVKTIETGQLLHPQILELKCAGWLYPERDLKKTPMTAQEQAMLKRATSNQGYHYFGSGRFFILLGKSFAETMQELMKK